MRAAIPLDIQTEVLMRTKRRCCLCFGLDLDDRIKQGQIAHLDKNRNNNSPSNLAFLCLEHHDKYDSKTSQSKGLTKKEVLAYQDELIDYISSRVINNLRASAKCDYSRSEMEEALKFHIGSHRAQSIVLMLKHENISLEELSKRIPPFDIEWTEAILAGVVYSGWARHCPVDFHKYELTLNGRRMLDVLDMLPANLKETAWKEIWNP